MINFKRWLEAVEDAYETIKRAVLEAIKVIRGMPDVSDEDILNSDIKNDTKNEKDLDNLINSANIRNLSRQYIEDTLDQSEQFTVKQFIDLLNDKKGDKLPSTDRTLPPESSMPPPSPNVVTPQPSASSPDGSPSFTG